MPNSLVCVFATGSTAAVNAVVHVSFWGMIFRNIDPDMEEEMATHSSILAQRIPGTGEPGELLSMGLPRVGHNWRDLAAAAAQVLKS